MRVFLADFLYDSFCCRLPPPPRAAASRYHRRSPAPATTPSSATGSGAVRHHRRRRKPVGRLCPLAARCDEELGGATRSSTDPHHPRRLK
uniref:Uncharacterized protein n=1 Tax=Oryza sativa subsp. japonica TaxID=39947 RepID=Q67V59_ORYSJ|nr:unknown protein [Oryza sativa Japonica Group]